MPSASRVLRCGRAKVLHGALVIGLGLLGPASFGRNNAQAEPAINQALLEALKTQLEAEDRTLECTNADTCFFCHATRAGGGAFTSRLFGELALRGFNFSDLSTAGPALLQLRADGIDTNEDGTTDWEQMAEFSNPNQVLGAAGAGSAGAGSAGASAGAGSVVSGKEFGSCDNARYGCGAHIAPPVETSSLPLIGAAAALLGALGFAARRRR